MLIVVILVRILDVTKTDVNVNQWEVSQSHLGHRGRTTLQTHPPPLPLLSPSMRWHPWSKAQRRAWTSSVMIWSGMTFAASVMEETTLNSRHPSTIVQDTGGEQLYRQIKVTLSLCTAPKHESKEKHVEEPITNRYSKVQKRHVWDTRMGRNAYFHRKLNTLYPILYL